MAIVRDTTSLGHNDTGTVSSITVSHTCTGSNLLLLVFVLTTNSAPASGVTYNGIAMTSIQTLVADGTVRMAVFGLLAPATGTHDIVATATGNTLIRVRAASYTGVLQSGLPDAKNTQAAGSTSPMTTSITTVAANCWTFLAVRSTGAAVAASTGSTLIGDYTGEATDTRMFDSNGALSAGSNSMTVTFPAGTAAGIIVSFAPVLSASKPTGFMTPNTGFWG